MLNIILFTSTIIMAIISLIGFFAICLITKNEENNDKIIREEEKDAKSLWK